jgi:hypothetical protein
MDAIKAGVLLLVAVLAMGCSTQARRVDCERGLRPINAPAPVQQDLDERP